MGNGGCGPFNTLCLCHSFLLTPFPGSSMGSLPWDTVLHELFQHRSFPQAAVLQELLQHGSFPWDTVLQEQTEGTQVLPETLLLHGLLSIGCSSCQEPAPCVGSPWAAASFRAYTPALAWGSPQAAGWVSALTWSFMGCRGTTCFTVVFSMGCRGISGPAPGVSLPPSSSLHLAFA